MLWWFFHRTQSPSLPIQRRVLGVLVLVAQWPIFILDDTLVSSILRIVIRTFDYFIYLRIVSDLSNKHSLYYSLFTAFVFTLASNIWVILVLSSDFERLFTLPLASAGLRTFLFSCVLRYLLEFLIIYAIYELVPIDDTVPVTNYRLLILSAVTVTEIVVRDSSRVIAGGAVFPYWQTSLHLLLLHLFLLLFIVVMERMFRSDAERALVEMQDLANKHRLDAIMAKRQHDEDVRRLNHDMKNHLLAIQRLAAEANNQRLQEYLDNLSEQLEEPHQMYEVGDDFLNGFLSQKADEAHRHGIRLIVDLSMPDNIAMRDAELSVVFGNLLDNAIEGCLGVADENRRFVLVKGRIRSGRFFLVIRNSHENHTQIDAHTGLPITSKEHPAGHGMGLRSVQRVIRDHGGVLSINLDRPGIFEVVVSFPLR